MLLERTTSSLMDPPAANMVHGDCTDGWVGHEKVRDRPASNPTPSSRVEPRWARYDVLDFWSSMPPRTAEPLRFARVRLLVDDFQRSWRFYRDRLGLTPAKGHGKPPYGEFVWDRQAIVALFDRRRMAAAVGLRPGRYSKSSVGRSVLVFEVKDVDAIAIRLRRKRVRLLQEPTDRPEWHLRTIHLHDPDGYLIEIYSELRDP